MATKKASSVGARSQGSPTNPKMPNSGPGSKPVGTGSGKCGK